MPRKCGDFGVPGDRMIVLVDLETESGGAGQRCDETEWQLPHDFASGLEHLVLTGRATKHVCDDGRVLYEIQWCRPCQSVTGAYHSH